ncbi:hypothetical protein PISL3812_09024 [Talaromyces islandicus]|uniref:Nephrocystin 3-like N-terminal domain-containing protein n=1 Tax=Talaromyces islandicus TaxID=28573 RepID=A0A0U1MAH2_TALIS|nr:hypothetical protein PISL3812_09024 [Talaromyces islandicus]
MSPARVSFQSQPRAEFFKFSSGGEFYRVRELDTLDWVINHPELLAFCKSKDDEFMCLQADPGCGKSVCTKSLLDEHVFEDGNGHVCACFITKYRPNGEKAGTALQQSVLYQIFKARPALMSTHAADKIRVNASSVLSDKELLWDILFSAVSDPAIGDQIVLPIHSTCHCNSLWALTGHFCSTALLTFMSNTEETHCFVLRNRLLVEEIKVLLGVYSSALRAAVDVDEPNIGIVKKHIDYGAEANYRGADEETILEVAAQHEEPQLVILLLRAGALPNVHSNHGKRWYEYAGMRNAAAEAGVDVAINS